MAQSKKINLPAFAKLIKEVNAVGEFIKALQDEKQSVMNDFDKERNSFRAGKISETTLISSVKKTNKELLRIDKGIRNSIRRTNSLTAAISKTASRQSPKVFRAHLIGVTSSKKTKKGRRHSKGSKRSKGGKRPKISGIRAILKEERRLDLKAQK